MDKFIGEKLQRLNKLTQTTDVNETNRAKIFFVAPYLEQLRDGKIKLADLDPEVNEIISELFEKNGNNKLTVRQSMMFDKLTGNE